MTLNKHSIDTDLVLFRIVNKVHTSSIYITRLRPAVHCGDCLVRGDCDSNSGSTELGSLAVSAANDCPLRRPKRDKKSPATASGASPQNAREGRGQNIKKPSLPRFDRTRRQQQALRAFRVDALNRPCVPYGQIVAELDPRASATAIIDIPPSADCLFSSWPKINLS
jgi:hypothetical protein